MSTQISSWYELALSQKAYVVSSIRIYARLPLSSKHHSIVVLLVGIALAKRNQHTISRFLLPWLAKSKDHPHT